MWAQDCHTELLLNVIFFYYSFSLLWKKQYSVFISCIYFSIMRHEIDFLFPLTCPPANIYFPKLEQLKKKDEEKSLV